MAFSWIVSFPKKYKEKAQQCHMQWRQWKKLPLHLFSVSFTKDRSFLPQTKLFGQTVWIHLDMGVLYQIGKSEILKIDTLFAGVTR